MLCLCGVLRRWCCGRRRARPPASCLRRVLLLMVPLVFQEPPGGLLGRAAWCARGRRPESLMVLLVAPRVFWAPEGPAAVCAGGRRPAREPSAPRASLGTSSRSPARPRRRPPAPRQLPPAPSTPVGPGALTCGLVRWVEARPAPPPLWAPQPGPVGQLGRLSETVIAFAGAGRASTETLIAFAGAKWVFLVQFSGAEVMPVSAVPCWGRAVVLVVSTSPRCSANRPCAQVL